MKTIDTYINEKLVLNKDNVKSFRNSVYDWLKVDNFVFYLSWDTPLNNEETFNDTLVIACGKIIEMTDDSIRMTVSDDGSSNYKITTKLDNYKIINDDFVFCNKAFRQFLLVNYKLFNKIIDDYFLKERIINLEDLIDLKDIDYKQKEYTLKEPVNYMIKNYEKIINTIKKNNNINEKLVLNKDTIKLFKDKKAGSFKEDEMCLMVSMYKSTYKDGDETIMVLSYSWMYVKNIENDKINYYIFKENTKTNEQDVYINENGYYQGEESDTDILILHKDDAINFLEQMEEIISKNNNRYVTKDYLYKDTELFPECHDLLYSLFDSKSSNLNSKEFNNTDKLHIPDIHWNDKILSKFKNE